MNTQAWLFHHPDFCPRVTVRRVSADLLDLVETTADLLASSGWSLLRGSMRSHPSLYMAQRRLLKAGLIVRPRGGARLPDLTLTPAGDRRIAAETRPRAWWNARWPKTWSVLVYDIPESERAYRDTLRRFLRRLRMGCLQGSVWISPRDIRPEYADLVEAGSAKWLTVLFEARTVLGQPADELVRAAWNWDRLERSQAWFLATTERVLQSADLPALSRARRLDLAREELAAYHAVMAHDPLLPRALWPPRYAGERVYLRHIEFLSRLARRG